MKQIWTVNGVFHISKPIPRSFEYFHIIVAKLYTTDHQSCQKPETLSVGHFFQKSAKKWAKWFLVYLNILTQSIAITDSMFNFGNFLTKNAITFDQKEIERQQRYLVGMKFCCASNAVIKRSKSQGKNINFFLKNIFNKIAILKKKYRFLENIRYFFRFWRFLPSFWLLIYLFRSNNKAMNQLFPTSCWIHEKLWKSCQLYILRPLYGQIMTPNQFFFSPYGVKLFFLKPPPPPPDRIGLTSFFWNFDYWVEMYNIRITPYFNSINKIWKYKGII